MLCSCEWIARPKPKGRYIRLGKDYTAVTLQVRMAWCNGPSVQQAWPKRMASITNHSRSCQENFSLTSGQRMWTSHLCYVWRWTLWHCWDLWHRYSLVYWWPGDVQWPPDNSAGHVLRLCRCPSGYLQNAKRAPTHRLRAICDLWLNSTCFIIVSSLLHCMQGCYHPSCNITNSTRWYHFVCEMIWFHLHS